MFNPGIMVMDNYKPPTSTLTLSTYEVWWIYDDFYSPNLKHFKTSRYVISQLFFLSNQEVGVVGIANLNDLICNEEKLSILPEKQITVPIKILIPGLVLRAGKMERKLSTKTIRTGFFLPSRQQTEYVWTLNESL